MEIVWRGKSYKKAFENLDITQEDLQELEIIYRRIYSSDKETAELYSKIYRDKFKKGKSAISWNLGSLASYFRIGREINPYSFMLYISSLSRPQKRSVFYLVKEIFKKKLKN